MILGISKPPVYAYTNAAPLVSSAGSGPRQGQKQQIKSNTSSIPLQTLVDIASTLFDESNRLEHNLTKRDTGMQQQQQQQCREGNEEPVRQTPPQTTQVSTMEQNVSSACATQQVSTARKTSNHPTTGSIVSSSSSCNKDNQNTKPRQHHIFQVQPNLQCCTREGFLSRLRSVLNDPSLSDVLSWMPDGEAFTIVSPKRFAKKGLVYQLFGIQKMSSFLRRLNQLGFARVRDSTDPTNLDIFRKPGFSAAGTANTKPVVITKKQATQQQRTESPTSTLQFAPATVPTTKTHATVPTTAPMSPMDSSSSTTSTSSTTTSCNDAESTGSSLSSLTMSPQIPPKKQHIFSIPPHHPTPYLAAPPLSMPAPMAGSGPVLLRPRGESFQTSSMLSTPATSIVSAPLDPPKQILLASKPSMESETPIIANKNKHQLPTFSPRTLQNLGVPTLGGTPASLRPPPVHFVAECIQQLMVHHPAQSLQQPIPMDIEARCDAQPQRQVVSYPHPPPHHTNLRIDHSSHMRLNREYLSLYQAAEHEADVILQSCPPRTGPDHQNYEASVLATVELLKGYNTTSTPPPSQQTSG